MPLIGQIAVGIYLILTAIIGWIASAILRPRFHGRQPCRAWFVFCVATLAAVSVFGLWVGNWGLGTAKAGDTGVAFGMYIGMIWGGIFAGVNTFVLWRAFDSPRRNYDKEKQDMMNTDVGVLLSRLFGRILSFRPVPGFANTGVGPWLVFFTVIFLSMMWALGFCVLTYLTEGAPGVKPVMPIQG